MNDLGRRLLLVLLALAVGGFGICALCGGVMGLSMLTEGRQSSRDIAWICFGFAAVGAVIAWLAALGFRRLKRKPGA